MPPCIKVQTHNNVFWVGALMLAVVRFPDFITPNNSIDQSLKTLAERQVSDEGAAIQATIWPVPNSLWRLKMILTPFHLDKHTLYARIRCLDLPGKTGHGSFNLSASQGVVNVY